MTPVEHRKVCDIEARLDRMAHWRRVRTVVGVMLFGAVCLWAVVTMVVELATYLGRVL